jgi:hypothetical protein
MVAAVRALAGVVPADGVIIVPERHVAFMVAWYTGDDVRLRPDGVAPGRRWRLLTLAFIRAGSSLDKALDRARDPAAGVPAPRGLHPRHPNGLVVMPEATWEWALAQLPPSPRVWFQAWHVI